MVWSILSLTNFSSFFIKVLWRLHTHMINTWKWMNWISKKWTLIASCFNIRFWTLLMSTCFTCVIYMYNTKHTRMDKNCLTIFFVFRLCLFLKTNTYIYAICVFTHVWYIFFVLYFINWRHQFSSFLCQ